MADIWLGEISGHSQVKQVNKKLIEISTNNVLNIILFPVKNKPEINASNFSEPIAIVK